MRAEHANSPLKTLYDYTRPPTRLVSLRQYPTSTQTCWGWFEPFSFNLKRSSSRHQTRPSAFSHFLATFTLLYFINHVWVQGPWRAQPVDTGQCPVPKMLKTRYVPASNCLMRLCELTCLARHYSYECKSSTQERPYVSRPSRSQQLRNPKLVPKLTSDTPNPLEKK